MVASGMARLLVHHEEQRLTHISLSNGGSSCGEAVLVLDRGEDPSDLQNQQLNRATSHCG